MAEVSAALKGGAGAGCGFGPQRVSAESGPGSRGARAARRPPGPRGAARGDFSLLERFDCRTPFLSLVFRPVPHRASHLSPLPAPTPVRSFPFSQEPAASFPLQAHSPLGYSWDLSLPGNCRDLLPSAGISCALGSAKGGTWCPASQLGKARWAVAAGVLALGTHLKLRSIWSFTTGGGNHVYVYSFETKIIALV